jgi:hypothetical protein
MKYADYFRQLAQRCRVLSKTAVEPEVIEQMRVWTVDFADEADEAERRGVERGPLADYTGGVERGPLADYTGKDTARKRWVSGSRRAGANRLQSMKLKRQR